ncbi:MAG: hypothetical protein V7K95_10590 [Nostoc sp.]
MGNGAWGIAKKLPMPNAQCPMPQAAGRHPSPPTLGMEFPADFNESRLTS